MSHSRTARITNKSPLYALTININEAFFSDIISEISPATAVLSTI